MEKMLAQCLGKAKYASKAAAIRRIEGQEKRKKAKRSDAWTGREMGAYRCPCCLSWHVGGSFHRDQSRPRTEDELDDSLLGMLPAGKLRKLGRA